MGTERVSRLALAIVLLFVLQREMASGEKTAIDIARMITVTQVIECLRVAFMNWRRSFSKRLRQKVQWTRGCQGMHTAEEVLSELVRVSVSGRDFSRPLDTTQRR